MNGGKCINIVKENTMKKYIYAKVIHSFRYMCLCQKCFNVCVYQFKPLKCAN